MKILKKADKILARIMDIFPVSLLIFLLVLLAANIFFRFVPIYSIKWYNEIVELAFDWLVFIGAAALWRRKEHTYVDYLPSKLEGKVSGKVLSLIVDVLSIAFVIVFLVFSIQLVQKVTAVSPILQIPRKYFYVSMPIAGSIMLIYSIRDIFTIFKAEKQATE